MTDEPTAVETPTETAPPATAAPAPAAPAAATKDGPRRLSLLAGLVAMVVASLRYVAGSGELDMITLSMGDATRQPLVTIVWHSLTAIFFLGGLLTLLSAWQSRGAARATALYSAVVFGTVAVIMLTVAAGSIAGPTAFWPVLPLSLVALLSLAAWIKA